MRTYSPKPADIQREWHVIDATDVVLGRLAVRGRTTDDIGRTITAICNEYEEDQFRSQDMIRSFLFVLRQGDGNNRTGWGNARFDSLLAKLIVHVSQDSLPAVTAKAYRALGEFRIAGAPTNQLLLDSE